MQDHERQAANCAGSVQARVQSDRLGCSTSPFKAPIPSDFKVGDTTLSTGEYTIEKVTSESPELLAVRDSDSAPSPGLSSERLAVVNGA